MQGTPDISNLEAEVDTDVRDVKRLPRMVRESHNY